MFRAPCAPHKTGRAGIPPRQAYELVEIVNNADGATHLIHVGRVACQDEQVSHQFKRGASCASSAVEKRVWRCSRRHVVSEIVSAGG